MIACFLLAAMARCSVAWADTLNDEEIDNVAVSFEIHTLLTVGRHLSYNSDLALSSLVEWLLKCNGIAYDGNISLNPEIVDVSVVGLDTEMCKVDDRSATLLLFVRFFWLLPFE